jgi:hypothetical protein
MNPIKPSKLLLRYVCLGWLGATLLLGSGCFLVAVGAAGAVGAGTVAYIRGELDSALSNDLRTVDTATQRAVGQLQFAFVSDRADAFTSEIIARTANDVKVEINLTKEADNLTKVQIRVGTFGDEPMSRAILDRIKSNL